jgi:hypothetical protein
MFQVIHPIIYNNGLEIFALTSFNANNIEYYFGVELNGNKGFLRHQINVYVVGTSKNYSNALNKDDVLKPFAIWNYISRCHI